MFKNKEQQREFQRVWMANRRAEYIAKHGGRCLKCQSEKNLEFHHRDQSQKLEHKIWSWRRERIEQELVKCDLLCRSCHFQETAKERKFYTAAHGTITAYKDYDCR